MTVAPNAKDKTMRNAPFKAKYDIKKKVWIVNGVEDQWHVVAIFSKEQIRQKILDKQYSVSSYDLKLLERLIKTAKAFDEDALKYGSTEVFIPNAKAGPLVLHVSGSNNYYMLAPRVWDNVNEKV